MGVVILVLGLWFFGLLFVEVHEFVEEFRSFSPNADLILSIALSTIFYLSRLILQDVLLLPLPHHQVVFLQQPYQQVGETARKQLKSLQDDERERILSNLEELELHPRKRRAKADIKKLHNTNPELYRLRVGGFRIICAVVSDEVLGALHKKSMPPIIHISTRPGAANRLEPAPWRGFVHLISAQSAQSYARYHRHNRSSQ